MADCQNCTLLLAALEQIARSEPGGHFDGHWYRTDLGLDLRNLREVARVAVLAARGDEANDQGGRDGE